MKFLRPTEALIQSASLLKRHALSAPFFKAFDAQEKGQAGDLMTIQYRDNEAIYVQAQKDRVTVFFSISFKDDTDIIFGKVFLQVRETPNFFSPTFPCHSGVPKLCDWTGFIIIVVPSGPDFILSLKKPPFLISQFTGIRRCQASARPPELSPGSLLPP